MKHNLPAENATIVPVNDNVHTLCAFKVRHNYFFWTCNGFKSKYTSWPKPLPAIVLSYKTIYM